MSNIALQIRRAVPTIDPIITAYAVGYIQHVSTSTEDSVTAQQVDITSEIEFMRTLLINAGGDEKKVKEMTDNIYNILDTKLRDNMAKLELTGDTSKRVLDMSMLNNKRDINSSLALLSASNDIEHTGRKMESRVDKKKLEKQERKIAKRWPSVTTSLFSTRPVSC